MYTVRPNKLLKYFLQKALWRIPTAEKKIYLTFDDGPVPGVTPGVLDQLDKYGAKATFFCVGDNVKKNPVLFDELKKRGHAIGNHTFNHLDGWRTENERYFQNIEQCDLVTGSSLFRPPYGKLKRTQYTSLSEKYTIVMWDVLAGDFDPETSPEKCLKNVISKTREGSIVVFHDSLKAKERMEYALPRVLKHFLEKGFTFEKLQ
jgi:peptidoglycan/xylan/chitin deacetylase (PgdA/CDA1 family)